MICNEHKKKFIVGVWKKREREKRQKNMPNIRCLIPRDIERPINSLRVCLRAACSYFYSLLSARQQVYLSEGNKTRRENESRRLGHLKYRSKCNTDLLNVLPARQYRILDLKASQIEFIAPQCSNKWSMSAFRRGSLPIIIPSPPLWSSKFSKGVQQRGIGTWNRRESTLPLCVSSCRCLLKILEMRREMRLGKFRGIWNRRESTLGVLCLVWCAENGRLLG